MKKDSLVGSIRPFLTYFAKPRGDGEEIPGRYDSCRDVWVIPTLAGETPLALAGVRGGETSTGTFVQAEQDDTDIDVAGLGGTITTTKVSVEGDDVDVSCASVLEVTTKTHAQIESEDVDLNFDVLDPEESWGPIAACRIH